MHFSERAYIKTRGIARSSPEQWTKEVKNVKENVKPDNEKLGKMKEIIIQEFIDMINREPTKQEIDKIAKRIEAKYIPNESLRKMPSSIDMIGVLNLFTGRNMKDMYKNVFIDEKEDYIENEWVKEKFYLVADNQFLFAKGIVEPSLFDSMITKSQAEFSYFINKHFSSSGLKHLLGFLVKLSETNKPYMEFIVKEHLDILGYKKNKRGLYNPESYQETIDFLKLITSIKLVIEYKEKGKDKIRWHKLFNIEGGIYDLEKRIHETLIITPTAWFQDAMSYNSSRPQFTYFFKELAKEDSYKHRETLQLVIFSIYWRMKRNKLSFNNLLNYLEVDLKIPKANRNLDKVYKELEYMKKKGYLKSFSFSSGNNPSLKELRTSEIFITFHAPEDIKKELDKVKTFIPGLSLPKQAQEQDDISILKTLKGSLSISKFAEKIGVSKTLLSQVLSGKKPISSKLKKKLQELEK